MSRILDGWKNHPAAFFLLYVAIFTGAAAWVGVRALRGRLTGRKVVDLVFPVALAIGGVALAVYGAVLGAPLFVIFAALGLVSATMSFQAWRRPPVTKLDGILLHARAIGSACIATVTALVVVNAPHLGLGRWTLVPWVLPGVLGGVLLALSTRKLRRASAAAKASRANVTA